MYTTEVAEKVARDASPEARQWIRELAKQRDQLRDALELVAGFWQNTDDTNPVAAQIRAALKATGATCATLRGPGI